MASGRVLIAGVLVLAACGGSVVDHGAPRPATTSTSTPQTTMKTRGRRLVPHDPSAIVLRDGDYPQGPVDEQGYADLFDEPYSQPFEDALIAAGLRPSQGAYTRSFDILPAAPSYGRLDSLAVVTVSSAAAHALLHDGAEGLLAFEGGSNTNERVAPPRGVGDEAIERASRDGTQTALLWRRDAIIGLLVVNRAPSQPRPDLARLAQVMDERMRGLAAPSDDELARALVLLAADYPEGSVREENIADLYDEASTQRERVLRAAGLSPYHGAFMRTFRVQGVDGSRVESLGVVLHSDRLAHALLRDGARELTGFEGIGGSKSIIARPIVGDEAVAFTGPGSNGGVQIAVVWRRGRFVGLLGIDRRDGEFGDLSRLARIMDAHMRAVG